MANFTTVLQMMEQVETYSEKTQFTAYILKNLENKRVKLTSEDKAELSDVAFRQIQAVTEQVPHMTSYREKDTAFDYADQLFGIIMYVFVNPIDVPPAQLDILKTFRLLMEKERFVENEIDHVFKEDHYSKFEVEHLLEVIAPVKDEFQKGLLYSGMLHYRDKLANLPEDSKALLADYIASEIKRYINGTPGKEMLDALEVACDVSGLLGSDTLITLLYDVLKLERPNLHFYVIESLLKAGKPIPEEAIDLLAHDLEYASMTYATLAHYGQADRFPADCADEVYLAKSTMIRWLLYPTELGQMPEEIEYLGKVKKKEVYHIFRFRSYSDTLDEETKGKWLIGWASEEGGTFSNFDLYKDFEQKTIEKTLKYIKRKLL